MSNNYIKQRIKDFNPTTLLQKQNALKQVIQEIVLNCLEKIGFYKEAAFCGGTCLRIFYNLNRFSEDLDFALIKPNKNFDLSKYLMNLSKLLKAFGLDFEFSKVKSNIVQSTFLKGQTKVHMLRFFDNFNASGIRDNELIRIKLEIDTNPPLNAQFQEKVLDKPITSFVKTYDASTMFAGKITAILYRGFRTDIVKGRDLYDFLFYINKQIPLNLKFLQNALIQRGIWNKDAKLTVKDVKQLLINKFKTINFKTAKADVLNFVKNEKEIENWSLELFTNAICKLK